MDNYVQRMGVLILAALMAVIAAGAMFINFLREERNEFESEIYLESGGVTTADLDFNVRSLTPGSSVEYSVNLVGKIDGEFTVSLDFITVEDGDLKDYITVSVECGGETALDAVPLTELLDRTEEDLTTFNLDMKRDRKEVINIRYDMIEADVEAMGASIDFNVKFRAQNNGVQLLRSEGGE